MREGGKLVNEACTQYQILADYYVKHENAASAIAVYRKMVQLEPENPTYHVKLAEIYLQQQLIEKARWGSTSHIIPVKLEECSVPDSLLKWQWVSLFDEAGYERLLRSLRARVGALGL